MHRGAPGFDCVLGNAAVYYPMLKDPNKFRIGFHMAGAGALNVNRMGSEALVTEDGFEVGGGEGKSDVAEYVTFAEGENLRKQRTGTPMQRAFATGALTCRSRSA